MTHVNKADSTQYMFQGIMLAGNILQQMGFMNSVWTGSNSFGSSMPANTTPASPTTAAEETAEPNTPENTPKKTDEQIKEDIKIYLKNNNVYKDFDSNEGKDIINITFNKYKAIKELHPKIEEAELSRRLCNYVKGYLYHQKENQFGLQRKGNDPGFSNDVVTNEDIKNAIDANDMTSYKKAFHQFAKEYVEFYDFNENGVEVNEFIRIEVAETEKELGRKLTDEEGKAIQEMALKKVGYLDMNKDNVLDENEIAGYLWARNKWSDNDASNMTYNDFNNFETALYGDKTITARQAIKNGYEGLK